MRKAFLTVVGACVCATLLWAAPVGSIKGYVKDHSGAVIPNAALVLTNNQTRAIQHAAADQQGYFQFLQLSPGQYELAAESAGFRKSIVHDITVQVDQIVSFDVTLEVGQIVETVRVEGGVSTIEPEKVSTGLNFDLNLVKNLPYLNRRFLDLASATPGVVLNAPGTQAGGFSAAGARAQSNNWLLDGVQNLDTQVNGPINSFRIADAIQEFSVTTTVASAEYGRGTGAQVNVVTKSGTNSFHGTGFYLNRNDVFDARDFFTNKLGGNKPILRRHQYGATIGGPVIHDRTFFFYSWERFWQNNPDVITAVVPTLAERASVVDPIARNLISYWPLPTRPEAPARTTNFVGNVPRGQIDNTHLGRMDHSFGDRNRLMGRYAWFGGETTATGALPNTGGNTNIPGSHSLVVSDTHMFSPKFIGELTLGFSRNNTLFRVQDHGFNPAPLFPGVPGVVDTSVVGDENSGLPRVTVTGYAALGSATNMPQGRTTTTYEVNAMGTKIAPFGWSSHTMKFGFQQRREEARRYLNGNMRGSVTFNNFDEFAGTCAACGGRALLNTSTIRTGSTLSHWYRYPFAFFFQDDIKVKRNLTMNLGLRYEFFGAMQEKHGRGTNFIDGVGPVLLGTNQLLDLDPMRSGPSALILREAPVRLSKSGTDPDWNNFAPVFGFAYTPMFGSGPLGDQKTVIRGGFRVAFDDIFNNIPVNQALAAPWNLTTTQTAFSTQPGLYGWDLAFNQDVPLVVRTTQAPGAPARGLLTFNAYDPDAPTTYGYTWNFGIQRELGAHSSIDVSYLGSAGHKLGIFQDLNEPFVIVRDPGRRGTQAPNEQAFPNPKWGAISQGSFQAESIYHGLVVSGKANFRTLLQLNGSYTFGHGIDNSSSFFGSDDDFSTPVTRRRLDLDRSNSGNDQRHRFVTFFVFEVPVGTGRTWLSDAHGLVQHLLGGWQISGVFNAFTGQPFTVYANTSRDFSGFNQFVDRPDIMGSGKLQINRSNPDNFFDPAYFGKVGTGSCPGYDPASSTNVALGCAPAGSVGTSQRNAYYGPGLINLDASVAKRFAMAEHVRLIYRVDFFNVANHTNFGLRVGNRSMSSGEFGQMTTTSEYVNGGPRIIQMSLRLEF
jgi:Carboxypeptidase regulatory-like domain/TonB-dependent Receptor Plug Domain